MDINSLTTSTPPIITAAGLNNSSNPVDAASIVPVVATPPDPTTIPIEPPHGSPRPPVGQLLPDVAAAEDPSSPMKVNTPPPSTPSPAQIQPQPVPLDAYPDQESEATNQASVAVNGHQYQNGLPESAKPEADEDMVMDDSHIQNSTNGITHPEQVANGSYSVLPDVESPSHATEEYDDGPPPAKRQKLESPDPLNGNEDSPGAGIPLDSPVAPTAPWARPMTQPQNKFALSVVRSMKKHKDAVPFLAPVDPVALNIPHYPTIVTNPMDLSTIERKLGGAPKPETAQYARYANVEEFVTDFRLIVQNCLLFNGPDHLVSQMAKRMEESFDKLMKNMPTADEVKPPVKVVPVKKVAPVRRPSTAGASAPRRDDSYTSNRPKREIPPPREQRDFQPEPRRAPVKKRFPKRDDGTAEQLKFCTKLINDLYRPKYSHCAYPFYEPVDIVKLDIPHYPKVVKKPMDMATMLQKLGAGEYPDAKGVYNDFKLMIKNCFAFNPAGTPVHQAGVELNEIFDEKWLGLPGLHGESDDEVGEDDESDNDHTNAVMLMEAQIQSLHNALASIKKNTKKDKLKKSSPAVPKPPKPAPAKVPGTNGNPFKKKKKAVHDDDEPNLTFEQKKQLSESIQSLDGARLEKVLEIIDEVYPEIRETSEEIELDIDSLPPHVLSKLYNFVIRPMKPRVGRPPNGVGSSNKPVGGAIAGTKRKSMNEEEETAKIRQLEETLYRLKNGIATADDVATAGRATANGGDDSGSDSDDSDSSGSDSE